MLTLKISKTEIQELIYERFYHPYPRVHFKSDSSDHPAFGATKRHTLQKNQEGLFETL